MSELYQSLSHSRWDCKYHVIFVPKRQRKVLYGKRAATWERSSLRWRTRKSARSLKGI